MGELLKELQKRRSHLALVIDEHGSLSGLVTLEPDGDFRIDDVLDSTPPSPCNSPVLLIVNAGGRWFAPGIPQQ